MSNRIREQFQQARRGELVRLCSALGCTTTTTELSGLCLRHRNARRRQGHELQRAIGLPRTGEDMDAMVAGLETVKRQAEDYTATHTNPQHRSTNAQGQPYTRGDRVEYAARQELARSLANLRDVRLAVILVTGMVVISEIEPSLIASDDAFLFQMARAVRRAGKPMQRGAKDPVPTRAGVMVEAGRRMHEALARVTLRLAREVRQQDEREHAAEMMQRDEDDAAWELSKVAKARQQNNDDDFYIDMNGKVQRRGA